jgi:TRAP-type C4-dicarboxylate transport system permease small subunit
MKYSKIITALLILVVLVSITIVPVVMAQTGGANSNGGQGGANTGAEKTFTLQNPLKVNSLGGLVKSIVEIFSYVVILLAVLMFIYVGFLYIMYSAQGNASKIAEQHQRLLWLVIGVAVVISARVIVDVVINTISATGTVSPEVLKGAKDATSL